MNRISLSRLLAPAVCLLAGGLSAADLKLDGRSNVTKLMGSSLQITVNGAPNSPVTLFFDASPGPVTVPGLPTFPIGFTPAIVGIGVGNTDGNGDLTLNVTVPAGATIHNVTLYMMAVILDSGQPSGLDVSNGASLTTVDRNTDLAGKSLGGFPHFQYTAAFNRGGNVEIAIDPTRFPGVSGQTADVYIVASKTRTQWIADTSLTDVAGGPQSITFNGSDIQGNTFTIDTGTLAGPDESAGSGDTALSVAYDVVVDFGQDGNFNMASDLIDGLSDAEAGFYVVRDLVAGSLGPGGTMPGPGPAVGPGTGSGGPFAVTEIQYDLGSMWTPVAGAPTTFFMQDTYYPSNIASMGQLPLIVISHGNGHNYQWYDHLGYHLASYGYIVMSHENNTIPGVLTASRTTLDNTDAFLGNLANIGGGVLENHVDGDTILWIGHSRGGEGVAIAYDSLFDDEFTMVNYDETDIKYVSSIAPVNFLGVNRSNPHDANYILLVGQGDTDVTGCADTDIVQWYQIHDRATNNRQSISLYGVGHDDFHNQTTFSFFSGPNPVGKLNTHTIIKGYYLASIRYYLEGDAAAKDYLWRQYEDLRPIGVPNEPSIVNNLIFQEEDASGRIVIDNFDNGVSGSADPSTASSGAAVSWSFFEAPQEFKLDDQNRQFQPMGDPQNGFTMGGPGDNSWGSVVGWNGTNEWMEWSNLPATDWRGMEYISLRAAQTTRFPATIAALGDLTFEVRLEDGNGNTATIGVGAYGGGVEEPYQRNTNPLGGALCSNGTPGWDNDFETIRIRLTDFLNNGNALDLADIQKVRLQFGPAHGSNEGRIGIDEIEVYQR